MPSFDHLLNAFVTLLVTLDPPGLAPVFLALTVGMSRHERNQVAARASVIAFFILVLFALFGKTVLTALGISISAFRVAGGLLLFFIAFDMIFERRTERKEKSAEVAITKDMIHNIAAFPLAIPLIAGPGAISATLLLSGRMPGVAGLTTLCLILLSLCVITYLVFMLADRIDHFLGETGRSILSRLLGLILAALAVQFVADGIIEMWAAID
ncbi:UPF0056 inner membrane protein [Nitratireductor aestuarii]|uniref:UPF0056 membrane protein n=1 Tax=Nitratireductor aestuarii TaxID=1735103 RepID=A0A916VYD8_9HYPH|nr:MarC family protein [Nitratireductor aestuarii]GGA53215.1 UPF0056 inner membrane protein [Nitratireductor aestuarii]